MSQELECGQPPLVAAHNLAVDEARPHIEVIHGLDHKRVALRPVVAPRVISRMPTGSRRPISRKPSCLIS
jgi:hypothetical protein